MKRILVTGIFVLVLVTMAAGIALAYIGPFPLRSALAGNPAAACGPVATTAIERQLDPPAHRLSWSSGPRVGAWQLVVADADGTGRATITDGDLFHGEPAWSPDGTKVAFVQRDEDEVDHVWISNPDGTDAHELVHNASAPAWSPDGSRIAYWNSNDRSIGLVDPSHPAPVKLLDTDALRPLVPFGGDPMAAGYEIWGRPAWSPDGTRLVFSLSTGSGSADLVTASLDGQLTRLTDTPDCSEHHPAWSPDGRILFSAWAKDDGATDLMAILPDGARERLTATPKQSEGEPAVSPDGRTIAVDVTGDNGTNTSIALLNADGTGATVIVVDSPADASGGPAWIP